MLSYQHSYHAGNHADVFKHLVLIALLTHLRNKDKPFFFADTHAGEGLYRWQRDSLNVDELFAQRLLNDEATPDPFSPSSAKVLGRYIEILNQFKTERDSYPGSSLFLEALARPRDIIHCNELHLATCKKLKSHLHSRSVKVHNRDAFEFIKAFLPPKSPDPKRGGMLIDPPYEDAIEYQQVVNVIKAHMHKWPVGIIAIWYPLLTEYRKDKKSGATVKNPKHGMSENMLEQLASLPFSGLIDCRFICQDKQHFYGMYGSGLAIINPPWKLDQTLSELLTYLQTFVNGDVSEQSQLRSLIVSP